MMMHNTDVDSNGVKGTDYWDRGPSPGRDAGGEQPAPGRHPVTARRKYDKLTNKVIMECYLRSDPMRRGFRKRMLGIWQEKGIFEISEQRLADQARAIRINGWLTELEIEEIARSIKEGGSIVRDQVDQVCRKGWKHTKPHQYQLMIA